MRIGDLSRAQAPSGRKGDLSLWALFLLLVTSVLLAGWLAVPPPGPEGKAPERVAAATPPRVVETVSVSAPQPAAPVRVAAVTTDGAYGGPVPTAPTAVETEPADVPEITGSNPVAPPEPPVAAAPPQPAQPAPVLASAMPAAIPEPEPADGLKDLNAASLEELNSLRGGGRIGKAIVRGRPYASVEDLVKKRVLNRSVYARIKDQVTVR
ncbi:helix-hairpin-helix domain-containing protein [Microvirga sp. GCM10011540]|uniref:ComEA family DNA-binding protein n=1 Tax=Microvirga sp. GCM10011540 TaxID=3317338 RepID=UPI003612425F